MCQDFYEELCRGGTNCALGQLFENFHLQSAPVHAGSHAHVPWRHCPLSLHPPGHGTGASMSMHLSSGGGGATLSYDAILRASRTRI
jgi:hypothetical protein